MSIHKLAIGGMVAVLFASGMGLLAPIKSEAVESAGGVKLLGSAGRGGGQNVTKPSSQVEFFSGAEAAVIDALGFHVTGTSGVDQNGFVEWISYQRAQVRDKSLFAGNLNKRANNLVGVELGQDSGWLQANKQIVINIYNESIARSNAYSQAVVASRYVMQQAAWLQKLSTDPNARAQYAQTYEAAADAMNFSLQLQQAEVKLQKTLRPGR